MYLQKTTKKKKKPPKPDGYLQTEGVGVKVEIGKLGQLQCLSFQAGIRDAIF